VLRTVLEHIEAHLGDDLGLDQLAGIAGVCPDFLVRAFRQSTGVPPHRYVVARRVARAQALLRARTGSISVIALRAGFGTPSSFTRAFHRTTGLTPREFQRQGEAGASHELQGQRVSLA
jgi:AraC family transcriptional regulator